ncbi:hypothetical protein [Klebsiella pneumoniae]|uniref:hypothetical protein n=1 Tax=Klebsiella pneumoniae TaxID=573 RepID=UPI000D1B67E3|nr:hypothetical protein [Klebsiella pneumoniae]
MKRIQSIRVTGTFNNTALLHYAAFIISNLVKGKTVKVYGDPATRKTFTEMIGLYLGPAVFDKVKIVPFPVSVLSAEKVGRGEKDTAFLFINAAGKFFPTIEKQIQPTRSNTALFVDSIVC